MTRLFLLLLLNFALVVSAHSQQCLFPAPRTVKSHEIVWKDGSSMFSRFTLDGDSFEVLLRFDENEHLMVAILTRMKPNAAGVYASDEIELGVKYGSGSAPFSAITENDKQDKILIKKFYDFKEKVSVLPY